MLYTILQIIAFQALFLLVYDLFLKRETFFNCNRTYLLITALLSFTLPFLKFPELKKITSEDVVIHLPEVFIGTKTPSVNDVKIAEYTGIALEQPQTPIWSYVFWIGVGLATLLFVFKISKLYWLKHKNPKRWNGNVLIVRLIKSSAAFSFFNTVFLGEKIPEKERQTIYEHELVHIKQLHTLDLMVFELMRIVFWFNPLIYIYQSRVKELHEYIADAKAVKQHGKANYYQSLLNQIFDVNNVSFTNTFFKKSLIKKRIAMLQKSKSKQVNLFKYAFLIPLVFGMLIYSSIEVSAQQKIVLTSDVEEQELTDEELIAYYYEQISKLLSDDKLSIFDKEISSKYDYTQEKYIPTKDEYLKYVAFRRQMGEHFKRMSENHGNTTERQKKMFNEMISFNQSYDEYLAYLKSDEAKKYRDNADYNRTLRVISKDIDNLTEAEHTDAYEKTKDVLKGSLYRKLIISDDNESEEITKNNYNALVRFFSVEEIKILLSKVEVVEIEEVDKNIEVPFSVIEEVPTTKKCKDLLSSAERKECMTSFVNKHVNTNFNLNVTEGMAPGKKRIFVQFKIDTIGYVKDVKARGPSKILEEEAIRVVNTLPQFVPGKQKGKVVTVPYSLPIVFQVADKSSISLEERLKELITQRDRVLQNSSEKNPVVIQLNEQINSLKKEMQKNENPNEN